MSAVLVVDDSLTVRMDLQEAFEGAGISVAGCATAEAARMALKESTFSLVVMDILLPDGNGVDLLMDLRSDPATTSLPVLLLSTEAEVRDRIRGVRMGADDYVGKPYDRNSLLARAQDILRRKAKEARCQPLVLVVEDGLSTREALKESLLSGGYDALLAASGEEGLGLAAAARPDAVIVDADLPGIDGPTFVRRLRLDSALRRTPCLLLTASEDRQLELTALEAGADGFLRKSEDLSPLMAHLSAVLRASAPAAEVEPVPSLFGPMRILAVDDSPTYLHEVADQIREEGYDVILAGSGAQALELLGVQSVDCILLALVLPGLSGAETCRRITGTAALRDIPPVMLTAQEGRETMIHAFNAGADDYISKTSDFEVIRARLRAQIRRKHFEDENRRFREELLQKEREAAEARAARELAQARAILLSALEASNRELESFSYSVSHDLRAPLRAIDGFATMLDREYRESLEGKGQGYLERIQSAVRRMSSLIENLMSLSRINRVDLQRRPVDLSALATGIMEELRRGQPEREVAIQIQSGLIQDGDESLLRAALENLLRNAWKYTSKHATALISFGAQGDPIPVYFVQDDGAGFDMAHVDRLFTPFQRLHAASDFEGSGIGLATVQRIVRRHGGRVWAEGEPGKGATFRFTLQPEL